MTRCAMTLPLTVVSLSGLYSSIAFAEAPKCIDARDKLKEQVEPLVDTAVSGSLRAYKDKYTLDYSKFYSTEETENARDCAATVTLTTNDGLRSQAEVRYRLVATEDGEVVAEFQDFNWKGLVFGIVAATISRAQKGMPSDKATREFYAPQGPGSFADRVRKANEDAERTRAPRTNRDE